MSSNSNSNSNNNTSTITERDIQLSLNEDDSNYTVINDNKIQQIELQLKEQADKKKQLDLKIKQEQHDLKLKQEQLELKLKQENDSIKKRELELKELQQKKEQLAKQQQLVGSKFNSSTIWEKDADSITLLDHTSWVLSVCICLLYTSPSP